MKCAPQNARENQDKELDVIKSREKNTQLNGTKAGFSLRDNWPNIHQVCYRGWVKVRRSSY